LVHDVCWWGGCSGDGSEFPPGWKLDRSWEDLAGNASSLGEMIIGMSYYVIWISWKCTRVLYRRKEKQILELS